MLELFWWGSVFLLALPVMAALLILGPRVLPEYRDPDAGRLDLLSAGMSVAAILAVIYGLKEIAQDGVNAARVGAIVAGLVVAVAFVARQRRLANPMIDLGLFRLRAFNAALATNFLAIFVAVGYFLFVAQYLQLVVGLSPLEAGLWSLPSAVGFILGSQFAPRVLHNVRPVWVISGGLALAAAGLGLLAQVGVDGGLAALVAGSVVVSLGMAPVFGLTTELIVGSAPPEQAGAASGISETGAELGGALGIAILGSIGIAIYRGELADRLPPGVPAAAAEAARDTLGGATVAAAQLPGDLGSAVLQAAREAFVAGMRLSSAIAAGIGVGLAILALIVLRKQEPAASEGDETQELASAGR
jgi:DHA2 family multidrug resistance protein-like MFS transporter